MTSKICSYSKEVLLSGFLPKKRENRDNVTFFNATLYKKCVFVGNDNDIGAYIAHLQSSMRFTIRIMG